MKKVKVLIVLVCLTTTFLCVGCGSKSLPSAQILRDDARTGGSLSFVYDKNQMTVYVGGEDEVVQYSQADESLGLEEGCRIGLKVVAPQESVDLSNASLTMNGVNYSSGDFLATVNGQKQRYFNLYPTVSQKNNKFSFEITWQDGTKKQEYKVVMVDGTKYMDKDGNVE